MGLLARIAASVERRWGTSSAGLGLNGWPISSLGSSAAYSAPTDQQAENLSAYAACISLISNAISALPATLQIDGPKGREPAPASAPAWRLLDRPNNWQSWPAWAAWVAGELLTHGNSISQIKVDARGAVTELRPVAWQWVTPQVVSGAGGPRLVLDVTQRGSAEAALLQLPNRMLDTDCLFIRQRSDFGIIGRSTLSRSPAAGREGLAIGTAAEANWLHGLRPSMTMNVDGYLSDAQRSRAKERMEEYTGAINAGRVPFLEGGWQLKPISATSLDSELLASRMFNVATICAAFGVPEVLLQQGPRAIADPSAFTTAFYMQAVVPLIALIEAEFDHAVLGINSGLHLVIDADGAMRGSFATMTAALCALLQSGAVTPNDVRAELDWPPIEGGDVLRVGGGVNYPADASGLPSMAPKPGPVGDGIPHVNTHQNGGSKMNGAGAGHA